MHEETNASVPRIMDAGEEAGELSGIGKKSGSSALSAAKSGASASTGGTSGMSGAAAGGGAQAGGLSSAISNAGNAITSTISKAVSSVTNFFGNIGSAVSNFFGGAASGIASTSVAVATAGTVGVAGVTGGVGAASNTQDFTSVVLSDSVMDDDCNVALANLTSSGDGSGDLDPTDPEICENAYLIYSVMTQWGMNDNQAYGMIANAKCESHLRAWVCQNHIADDISEQYPKAADYTTADGDHLGVGLWQYTYGPTKEALDAFAESRGTYWYDRDTQIAFNITDVTNGKYPATVDYKEKTADFPVEDCTRWFLRWWEICSGANKASDYDDPGVDGSIYNGRWKNAPDDSAFAILVVKNYKDLGYYTEDIESHVTSIIQAASAASSAGEANASNSAKSNCGLAGFYDNSSIASAAISFSWPTVEEAENNGTELYQTVYNNIIGDGKYYKACERVMKCAVCWSGSDDNIKNYSNCNDVYTYLESDEGKKIWTKVGVIGTDIELEDCLPGDIAIITSSQRGSSNGHTFVYVGEEMIANSPIGDKVKPGSNIVQGNLDKTSAHCDVRNGADGFSVYRCTNPMNSDKYKDAGGGVGRPSGIASSTTTSTTSGTAVDTTN